MTRYIVMIKQVPDTSLIEIDENGNMHREGVPSMLDPFSFFALQMAIRMRGCTGGSITAVTMGPPQATEALLRCLEFGADEAFLLTDRGFAGADTWATARTLAKLCQDRGFDFVLCGKEAADGNTGQVPAELSAALNVELASYAVDFAWKDERMQIVQNYEGDYRTIELQGQAVISVSKGPLLSEGLPSISDHLAARKKTISTIDRVNLGLGVYSVGMKGSHTKVVSSSSPMPVKKNTVILDGTDTVAAAAEIIREARS